MNNLRQAQLSISETATRTLPWNAVSTWIAIIAALVFLVLGLRALLAPVGAASFFGLPVPDVKGLAFVRAFGARNIGLSLLALALIVLDLRMGLAVLFLAAGTISGLDAWIVTSNAGIVYAIKHFVYLVGMIAFGIWLL